MSTITAILEANPDGTLHMPLPEQLRHGKWRVTARVELADASRHGTCGTPRFLTLMSV